MQELLISNARCIRYANAHGIKKMLRNILALRQNIKTLSSWSPDSEFSRARAFYGLFFNGPQVRYLILLITLAIYVLPLANAGQH